MDGQRTTRFPDGEKVAYTWAGAADDNWEPYVKALGAGADSPRLTEDPAHDRAPAWSPDGRQIALVRELDGSVSAPRPVLPDQSGRACGLDSLGFALTICWTGILTDTRRPGCG